MSTLEVVGVDSARRGWIAVRLTGGRYAEARLVPNFHSVLEAFPKAVVIAVDIPIGLPSKRRRRADEIARRILGSRRNSVFLVPPRPALEAPTFKKAVSAARNLDSFVSQQIYALRHKVLEVDRMASHKRIVEVHPEVSFWAMNSQRPLTYGKRTWNGLMVRLELLRKAGVKLPAALDGIGDASADDIVDAAAAAWSGLRVARGQSHSLPEPPQTDRKGRPVAIWY